MKEKQLLELAAYAEDYSNHPISLSVKKAYGKRSTAPGSRMSRKLRGTVYGLSLTEGRSLQVTQN